jgi:hypothetical protein
MIYRTETEGKREGVRSMVPEEKKELLIKLLGEMRRGLFNQEFIRRQVAKLVREYPSLKTLLVFS